MASEFLNPLTPEEEEREREEAAELAVDQQWAQAKRQQGMIDRPAPK